MRMLPRFVSAVFMAATRMFAAGGVLEQQFKNPPESAKPWVFWYWMQAND